MTLVEWLSQLLSYETDPERVDSEALEQSVLVLRERSEYNADLFARDDGQTEADVRLILVEMAEIGLEIAQDLDRFLDSYNFQWVRLALLRSHDLDDIRNDLFQRLEYSSLIDRQQVAA